MQTPLYYRARIKAIDTLLNETATDEKNIDRLLLYNGVVPDNLQNRLNDLIEKIVSEKRYGNDTLGFDELCQYNTWFAMHPEKIAGQEYVTTSIFFPLMIKGTKDDILNTVTPLPASSGPSETEMQIEFEMLALELELQAEKPEPEQNHEHPKSQERFTTTKYVPRNQITTDPKTFQGRQQAYAKETVDKIVREGYDKTQDPIVCWYDTEKQKYIVISGHSRWRASEILFEKGDKSLAEMPIKVFIGTKDEAIEYAILESNRSATAEGFKSDLKAYKRALASGYNRERLKGLFKPESYLNYLQEISYLDENGLFLQHLGEAAEQSFPYLKRNSSWVGNMRKLYPQLTNLHEKELFEYIYSTDKGLKLDKAKLFDMVDRRVMTIDFDSSKALNLKNIPSSSAYTDPAKERLQLIEKEIKDFERQRSQKEETIVRAKQEGKTEFIDKLKNQIADINAAILRKIEERTKVEHDIAKLKKTVTTDLFSKMAGITKKKLIKEIII